MAVWNLNPRTLVANSGLAVCSRAPETGGPTFAAVWMVVVGGSAEFATRSTARGGARTIMTRKSSVSALPEVTFWLYFRSSVPRDRVHTPCSTAGCAFWPKHPT